MTPLRINLEQEDIPTHWYNVFADMVNPPAPPLGPDGNSVLLSRALRLKHALGRPAKIFSGQLEDFDYPAEAIAESLKHLPKVG